MDSNFLQQRMSEIQNDASFANAFGKLISGRAGYTPVIEKKQIIIKCKNCGKILEDTQKFCDECGTKVERLQDAGNN
jgi:rRNA maturation endonuclease Nob1